MINLIQMSISAAVLIFVIAAIRKLFIHKLPKLTFNALWIVVILRLVIPFSFSVSIPGFIDKLDYSSAEGTNYFMQNIETDSLDTAPEIIQTNNTATIAMQSNQLTPGKLSAETNIDYITIIKIVWLCGGIALAVYFLAIHFICRQNYKMSVPLENELIKNKLSSFNLARKITVKTNDMLFTPITYGIIKPVILLPKTLDFTDEKHFNYILSHEVFHIKRFDIAYKWVMTAVLCLHWFNPLVWLMYVLANRDIELACDEAVVKQYNGARTEYAKTLISLEEKRIIPPFANGFGGNSIRERIISVMKINKTSITSIITAVILVIGSTIVFTSAVSNNNTKTDTTEKTTETNVISPKNENYPNDDDYDDEWNSISMKESIQLYEGFGLTYDENEFVLYFKGNPVRELWDVVTGILITESLGTDFPENAVDVIPIYKNGKLTGLRQATDEEYQRRTNERITKAYKDSVIYYDEGNTHFIFVNGANMEDAPTVSVTPGHISIVLVDKNGYWKFGSYNDISTLQDDVQNDCIEMLNLKDTNNGFKETYMEYVIERVIGIIAEANFVSASAIENASYSAVANNTTLTSNDNSSANTMHVTSDSASESATTYADSTPDIEYNKILYAVYDEYGIKYNEKTNKLYYKDKAVKYFIDEKKMIHYYDKDGTISLSATYNINKLNGVKQIKNDEAKKITDEFKHDTAVTAITYEGIEFIFDENFLSLYSDFGITADYETNCYSYKDKPIAGFCDKGGWIMTDGGAKEYGGIYLSVNRKDGKIVNFSIITEEKFSELSGLTVG